jgi:hypothetical protein
LEPKIRTLEIATKVGPLKARYEIFDYERVLILVGKHKDPLPFDPGSVMVRNGKNWSAHQEGLFSAWRGGVHIEHQGGLQIGVRDSAELLELFRDTRSAREYVKARLSTDTLSALVQTRHEAVFDQIIRALRTKTNTRKLIALMNFERAQEPTDSLGRNNPAAAAMAGGAGIGRLLERQEDVKHILSRVNVRTFRMWQELKRIERCYREFLRLLGGRSGKSRSRETIPVLVASNAAVDWQRATEILEAQMNVFRCIRAKPFRRNKFQLSKDLARTRDAFMQDGIRQINQLRSPSKMDEARRQLTAIRSGLEDRMAIMRQGITWMLAKFHLEMKVIAPLSWLMADVRADRSVMLRANGEPTRDELEVHSSMHMRRFQEIKDRLDAFNERASERSDDHLRTRVQSNVLAHTKEAQAYMQAEDWEQVKKELATASNCL